MKRPYPFLTAAIAICATPAVAQPSLKPVDLFSLAAASTPAVRPDGGLIAYVKKANDVMTDRARTSLWLVDSRTGAATAVATGEDDAGQPCWSPDGQRLAFVRTTAKGAATLYVYTVATRQTTIVSPVARPPSQLAWSADGASLAFVMAVNRPDTVFGAPLTPPAGATWAHPLEVIDTVAYRDDGIGPRAPGYPHLFVVPASGGAPRQVTDGAFEDGGPLSWTPDGAGIVFTSRRKADWQRDPLEAGIYRVAVADGAITELAKPDAPHADARLSPDGRQIAFTTHDERYRGYENARLWVMDSDGGHPRMLAGTLDRSFEKPVWSADGRSLYADYADRGVTKVARVDVARGSFSDVATGLAGDGFDLPYSGGTFSVGGDGTLAVTQGAADHPADLVVSRKGKATRLTYLNGEVLGQRTLGAVQSLAVSSSVDGAAVDAWLVLPPGFDPKRSYPLILEIHGGPFASYGPTFATDGIDRSYPGTDYDDLMSTVDAAIAKGFIDKDRLYVTGGSGGGVLTTWIVGKTHRFRAAVAQKPVVNWSSEVLTSDIYPWMAKYWFGKAPWEDPQSYWARSPLSLVGNVTTPTMLIVGAQDVRTPVPESEQYYGALQMRGVPTALVKVPGAFHDMAKRPSQSAAKANAVLAWFALYGGPAAEHN